VARRRGGESSRLIDSVGVDHGCKRSLSCKHWRMPHRRRVPVFACTCSPRSPLAGPVFGGWREFVYCVIYNASIVGFLFHWLFSSGPSHLASKASVSSLSVSAPCGVQIHSCGAFAAQQPHLNSLTGADLSVSTSRTVLFSHWGEATGALSLLAQKSDPDALVCWHRRALPFNWAPGVANNLKRVCGNPAEQISNTGEISSTGGYTQHQQTQTQAYS
jgi:hypothetical protein